VKTYSAKPTDVNRKWYILDAQDLPLGRLASEAAKLLIGKNKPMFTKHIDTGDFVVVINSDLLVVTGDKLQSKMYYKHSGYPGGLKELTLKDKMNKDSRAVIERAIRGMLPVNKLRDARLQRLKIYTDDKHEHTAQKPSQITLKDGK
jgi:large subunit ribosomal protein L13